MNEFIFVCGYCGYESNSNEYPCFQCGCEQWLIIEELTPKERNYYGIESPNKTNKGASHEILECIR